MHSPEKAVYVRDVKRPVKQPRRSKQAASPEHISSSSPESIRAGGEDSTTSTLSISQQSPGHTPIRSADLGAVVPDARPSTTLSPLLDINTSSVGEWLDRIYESCFEQIFGFWLGRDCCPFIWDVKCEVVFAPSRLFAELDEAIDQDWESHNLDDTATPPSQRLERNCQIDRSLRHAIRSFASQWLHITPRQERVGLAQEEVVLDFWRRSRRDMLKVINRVSYRSVLTLFLFGLTPIPVGVSKDEEMDGLTGQICVQAALQQVQRLRERQRNCQFNGSKVSLNLDPLASPKPTSLPLSQTFLSSESRAYWGALTFDTSSSLTLNFRSSLTSGLHGVGSESAWRVLRMGAHSFRTRTQDWRTPSFEVSHDTASQIIAAAAACKVYVWKMIAVLKEALREGDEEEKVEQAWAAFIESVDVFQDGFRPLLNACGQRLHALSQVERLNWYEVMLHYHLGILMLVDAVGAAVRNDLLRQLTEHRLDAEREVVNALKVGLESTIVIRSTAAIQPISAEAPVSITASFVQIDPYPHHIVAGVQLMNKVISRDYRLGNINLEKYRYLESTLLKALEELPPTSKSVQEARQHSQTCLIELEPRTDRPRETEVG
ncbi:hypothetical protein LTR67_004304 [Exophiala xenobiotica]